MDNVLGDFIVLVPTSGVLARRGTGQWAMFGETMQIKNILGHMVVIDEIPRDPIPLIPAASLRNVWAAIQCRLCPVWIQMIRVVNSSKCDGGNTVSSYAFGSDWGHTLSIISKIVESKTDVSPSR
jgi:hypothetical protein